MKIIKCIFIFLCFAYTGLVHAQGTHDDVPKVFFIGEYESAYEQLSLSCSDILISVSQDSMDLAYRNWVSFLSDIEDFAKKAEYDINGIKLWMNAYWNDDGTIKHLVYYPKPNSRNINFEELTNFLTKFSEQYQFQVQHSACFSHHGSASFPTFAKYYQERKKG